ncbi:FAD-dependent oxidoreductase [Streptomyces sp.]|uniref:FAD-dependent oxidoreductase n=1 Tax=Streptomyces sp. TaxID=1931 RepID=UPI002D77D103|nr:FAD-dependent monooxygenase [Streptomyces sp.]HET6353422.1 FAD-dependent monooxygenase [Streptomyces sp.]
MMHREKNHGSPTHTGTDVLIIGAGPTGLMLGCELRRRGIDCVVVDRETRIDRRTRAVMVHAAGLEQFQALDLRTELEARGIPQQRISFHTYRGARYTIGFAGLDTAYPYFLNVPQPEVEAVLAAAYRDMGGRLIRGLRYERHTEDADEVRAELTGDAGTYLVTAHYLVGADGASSTVRERLGVGFPGVTYPMSYLLAEGTPAVPVDRDESAMYIGPAGAVSLLPLPDGLVRIAGPVSAVQFDRDTTVEVTEFQSTVDRLGFGSTLRLAQARRVAHYQVHERLADCFRTGRAALSGDAAHLNSPAGGQAMNTGFGDAAALAWRLGHLFDGADPGPAGPGLLDDYARERRAVASDVARTTGVLWLLDAMRDAATPASHQAVEDALSGLAEAWSQLYVTYPAADSDGATGQERPHRDTYRLRPGARVPGHTPDPHRFTLLLPPGSEPSAAAWVTGIPEGTLSAGQTPRQAALLPVPAAVLVRPDGHVATVLTPPPGGRPTAGEHAERTGQAHHHDVSKGVAA